MNLLSRGFPRHVQELIVARADGTCEACGIQLYDNDYQTRIAPARFVRRGNGPWDATNGLLMCGNHSEHYDDLGWRVPAHVDPATRRAWVHLYGWVNLTNDGKYAPAKVGGAA